MALTPEDLVSKSFTITKFRDGYDLDEVDDFLDQIAKDLREQESQRGQLEREVAELKSQLEECETARQSAEADAREAREEAAQAQASIPTQGYGQNPAEQTIVVDAPAATPQNEQSEQSSDSTRDQDAVKSSAMLKLALELHDKYISEGEARRDQIVGDAESTAAQILQEAQQQRNEQMTALEEDATRLRAQVKDLRDFESEYRTTLRSYIESQLRNLDGSPEPDGAPSGLY